MHELTPSQPKKEKRNHNRVKALGGRFVTVFDPGLGALMCERIAEGDTLSNMCKEETMPSRQTFHRWIVNQPELHKAYLAARELSAFSMEEEAIDMARAVRSDPQNAVKVRAYEVALNQLRWSAARRNPRVYSERGQMVITVPIQINTTLDMSEGDSGPPRPPDNVYDLKANVTLPATDPIPGDDPSAPLLDDQRGPNGTRKEKPKWNHRDSRPNERARSKAAARPA
jgi:hypothetical protein